MSTTDLASPCIVCGGRESAPLYRGLLRCCACGHAYADLRLSDEQLRDLYRKSYFFGEEYSDYVADRAVLQRNFRLRLATLKQFVDPARHRRLFEIGSAYGFFLEAAREQFATVAGIDITEDGVRYAREQLKLDVIEADLLTYPLGEREFDVVCMWDTIEHLREPHRYVEVASRHMRPGGLLAVTTGDIGSLVARLQGENWRLIHPPTHLHYFTRASLARLLANYGFAVVSDRHCGYFRSLDNAAYNLLVLRRGWPRPYSVLKRSGLAGLPFYLNLYDISYCIARKVG